MYVVYIYTYTYTDIDIDTYICIYVRMGICIWTGFRVLDGRGFAVRSPSGGPAKVSKSRAHLEKYRGAGTVRVVYLGPVHARGGGIQKVPVGGREIDIFPLLGVFKVTMSMTSKLSRV